MENAGRALGKIIFTMRMRMNEWGDKKNDTKDNANQYKYFPGLKSHVLKIAS